MPRKTTLVLGAGASKTYGYPVGSKLREYILLSTSTIERNAELCGTGVAHLKAFVDEFRYSQQPSIDAFLARRMQEFGAVGKSSVARIILAMENEGDLFREDGDHWYQYLVRVFTRADWDALDFTWLKVVTFNYDRSLEWYLCRSLMSSYAKTEEEVVEKLSQLEIHHVYGCIGTPWRGPTFIPYGNHRSDQLADHIAAAASRLRVIPEGRDDDAVLVPLRQAIADAAQVCFLGFSYDETNLARLGAPLPQSAEFFLGTCVGLTDAETTRAFNLIVQARYRISGPPAKFMDVGCLDLLRRQQVLLD